MNVKVVAIILCVWIIAALVLLFRSSDSERNGIKDNRSTNPLSHSIANVSGSDSVLDNQQQRLTPEEISRRILAPLLDPKKLATLRGDRPINGRLYRVLFWLEIARADGGNIDVVVDHAQDEAGYGGTQRAKADKLAIVNNYQILKNSGSLTKTNLERMKRGASPEWHGIKAIFVDIVRRKAG